MKRLLKNNIHILLIMYSALNALPLQVGDVVPDFSVPVCENGDGDFNFYERANGDVNGGVPRNLAAIFASW